MQRVDAATFVDFLIVFDCIHPLKWDLLAGQIDDLAAVFVALHNAETVELRSRKSGIEGPQMFSGDHNGYATRPLFRPHGRTQMICEMGQDLEYAIEQSRIVFLGFQNQKELAAVVIDCYLFLLLLQDQVQHLRQGRTLGSGVIMIDDDLTVVASMKIEFDRVDLMRQSEADMIERELLSRNRMVVNDDARVSKFMNVGFLSRSERMKTPTGAQRQ